MPFMNEMEIMSGDEPLLPFISPDEEPSSNCLLSPCGIVLHLNVGGVRYITTYSTLLSKGSNFFRSLLAQRMDSTRVKNLDQTNLCLILNILIDRTTLVPGL